MKLKNKTYLIGGVLVFFGLLIGLAWVVLSRGMRRWMYEKHFADNAKLHSIAILTEYRELQEKGEAAGVSGKDLVRKATGTWDKSFTDRAGNPLKVRVWEQDDRLYVCINAPGYDGKHGTTDDLYHLATYPKHPPDSKYIQTLDKTLSYGRCGEK